MTPFAILPRYIARRYLFTFSMNFIGIILLIFFVDFGETNKSLSNVPGYTAKIGALLSILHIPAIIQISIPFVVLTASINTLMGLNRKYELVIARASGLSAWQFLLPILLSNFIIGILAVTVLNPLGAAASRYADVVSQNNNLGQTTSIASGLDSAPWIRQSTSEGSSILGGRSTSENGSVLHQATFLRFDKDNQIQDRIEAEKATLSDGFWLLKNVHIYQSGKPVRDLVEFQVKTNLQAEFIEEAFASADSVSVYELADKIAAANSFGLKANVYLMKLHKVIALPAFLVAMTLIAAMVSLTFVRFGQSLYAILSGILCGFLLYVMSELITAFGEAGSVPPIVAAWLPVIVAITIGTTILLHKEDG